MINKIIRNTILFFGYILNILSIIVLFIAAIKSFLFEYYNPADALRTFVYLNAISILLLIIRWIIKPEYKSKYTKPLDYSMGSDNNDLWLKDYMDDEEK